ncbi:hypothetical protein MCOR14_010927 [Pyricularia oryzae]|nr:hypothetical protein MCOR14_010927 [Pyricularia oryzae]
MVCGGTGQFGNHGRAVQEPLSQGLQVVSLYRKLFAQCRGYGLYSARLEDAIRLLIFRRKPLQAKYDASFSPRQMREGRPNNAGMERFLQVLQLDKRFDFIHVTGTKGKGSTCAWTDALLRSHFRSNGIPGKVGLFTSPHLTSERERIRTDFVPVSEAVFAERFFHVWNTLFEDANGDEEKMPRYFQLLTLLSVDIFNQTGTKVGIYEVNIGGRWDSTNCWDDTVVCGFNTIGLDHTPKFGRTIPEIARNKAGIMKPGCLAFSVPQTPEVREQLEEESNLVGCPFVFINDRPSRVPDTDRPELLLEPVRNNFALAIELADAYLKSCLNSRFSDEDIIGAVHIYDWPGRFQMVEDPGTRTRFYLDSPANFLSIPVSLDWFITQVQHHASAALPTPSKPRQPTRILIFGHDSTHRDASTVARAIASHCYELKFAFDKIILTSYKHPVNGLVLFGKQRASETMGVWKEMYGSPVVSFAESVEDVLESCRPINDLGSHVLIAGHTDLVSSALPVLMTRVKLKLNKLTSYDGTSGGSGARL